MGHAGASGKSPRDAPWETLSIRLNMPISAPRRTGVQGTCGVPAPHLTAVLSWRYEEEDSHWNIAETEEMTNRYDRRIYRAEDMLSDLFGLSPIQNGEKVYNKWATYFHLYYGAMGLQVGRDCIIILMVYYFSGLVPLARIQLSLVATLLTILASWRYFKGSTPCKNRQTKMASQSNPLWDTWAFNFYHDVAKPDTGTQMVKTANELGWELLCSPLSALVPSDFHLSAPFEANTRDTKFEIDHEVRSRDQSRSVSSVLSWDSTEDCEQNNR